MLIVSLYDILTNIQMFYISNIVMFNYEKTFRSGLNIDYSIFNISLKYCVIFV